MLISTVLLGQSMEAPCPAFPGIPPLSNRELFEVCLSPNGLYGLYRYPASCPSNPPDLVCFLDGGSSVTD